MQKQPPSLDYVRRRARPRRPWFWTCVGVVLSVCAVALWIATFEPHGGAELSWFLFPIARLVLDFLFRGKDIDPVLWYGSAVLQWAAVGALLDLGRWLARRRAPAA